MDKKYTDEELCRRMIAIIAEDIAIIMAWLQAAFPKENVAEAIKNIAPNEHSEKISEAVQRLSVLGLAAYKFDIRQVPPWVLVDLLEETEKELARTRETTKKIITGVGKTSR